MKVIVIGAGNAGLVAAEKLARGGLDVSVFEKNAYENLSYDWHDDVNAAALGRKIPSSYDEDEISSWRAKIEKTVYGK